MHRKSKKTLIGGISAMGLMAGISLLGSSPALATSSITINPGSPVGNTNLVFEGYNTTASTEYYIPVKIDYTDIKDLTISVYARNDTNTTKDLPDPTNIGSGSGGGSINTVSLLGGTSKEYTLDSIAFSKPVTDMNNEWGYRYKLANTNGVDVGNVDNSGDKPSGLYKPMHTINTTNKVIAEAKLVNNELPVDNTGSGTKYLNLGFGAGVTKSKEAVTYTGYAEIMVVANPNIITLFDIAESNEPTMQRITTEICRNTPTPSKNATSAGHTLAQFESASLELDPENGRPMLVPEVILKDSRDNNEYLIRKLADGNCWMSENLRLNFLGKDASGNLQAFAYAETALNATGLDGAGVTSWTGTKVSGTLKFTSDDTDLPEGTTWTPATVGADKVFATIITTRDTGNATSYKYGWRDNGGDGLRSYSYEGSVVNCAAQGASPFGIVICANPGASWAYSKWDGASETSKVYEDSATGERSGRRGTLYNYAAAVLGTAPTTNNINATASICPKGWQLPTNTGDRSFRNLLTAAYGLAANGNTATDIVSTKFRAFPLDFLPTGSYYRSRGDIFKRITDGYWWSGTSGASSGSYARYLASNSSYVDAGADMYRGFGFAVRCVAK